MNARQVFESARRSPMLPGVLVLLAGGLIILLIAKSCAQDPLDDAVVQRAIAGADSLEKTRAPDSTKRADLKTKEASQVAAANVTYRASLAAQRDAAKAKVRADSASALAERLELQKASADSQAAAWKLAYTERTTEAHAATRRADSLDRAFHLERDARLTADTRADLAETRLTASDRVTRDLREAVDRVNSCRVLWVAPCPSRTTAAVAGAGIGAIAITAIRGR